jgi:hypothetical protein
MFDTYNPALDYSCPVCDSKLKGWQGKDGPCGLFVWTEKLAAPSGQNAGDSNISLQERGRLRLPERFMI